MRRHRSDVSTLERTINEKIQKFKNSKIQKFRNSEIQNLKILKFWDFEILRFYNSGAALGIGAASFAKLGL